MDTPSHALQGYAFAEYSLPTSAAKAKDDLEARFRTAFQALQTRKLEAKVAAQKAAAAAAAPAKAAEPAAKATDAEMTDVKGEGQADDDAASVKPEHGDAALADAAAPAVPAAETAEVEPEAAVEAADVKAEAASAVESTATGSMQATTVEEAPAQGQIKILRAEFSNTRSVYGLFARNLYLANLPQVSLFAPLFCCSSLSRPTKLGSGCPVGSSMHPCMSWGHVEHSMMMMLVVGFDRQSHCCGSVTVIGRQR